MDQIHASSLMTQQYLTKSHWYTHFMHLLNCENHWLRFLNRQTSLSKFCRHQLVYETCGCSMLSIRRTLHMYSAASDSMLPFILP
jgi:hypothetical protein